MGFVLAIAEMPLLCSAFPGALHDARLVGLFPSLRTAVGYRGRNERRLANPSPGNVFMGSTGFSLLEVFAVAALVVIACAVVMRLWARSLNEKARTAVDLSRKEADLEARELRARMQLEMDRQRVDIQKTLDERKAQLDQQEARARETRELLDRALEDARAHEDALRRMEADLASGKREQENVVQFYRNRLKQLSKMSEDELRDALRREVEMQCQDEVRALRTEIVGKAEREYRDEARRVLVDTMQRLTANIAAEAAATLVRLPNDEMKGRIIGREGRNIKAFESATGTTLMIDETPDCVLVSSFDPVRREIARLALERLIADGRIHPASIEDAVVRAKEEVEGNVASLGEKAVDRLHLARVPGEVSSLLGKLHYRLSNNQNTLAHSVEVAELCGLIAAELGLEVDLARRAGLFHDIGKAIDSDVPGSHALAGASLLRRLGEDPRVVNAVAAHHNEVAPESVYAGLVLIADGLSATRPGARSESLDGYIQRLRRLEEMAKGFDGVQEAYALQAGREIRIIVAPDKVNDGAARALARDMRRRIEEELQYPGSIRVTVIREQRFSETAK